MMTLNLRPLAMALAATAILFPSCDSPSGDGGGTKPRPSGPQFQKEGILHFINEEGDTLRTIDIEIADTESERTIGLMHRRSMPDTQGMLFIFEEEERRSFWMRNTLIGLDIMFIRANGEVESIAKYTVPLDERSIPSKGPSTYVLEVIEGFCDRYGVKEGTKVAYERTDGGNAP
jgi:uncharacterized membrane protein (UPF0127 family)